LRIFDFEGIYREHHREVLDIPRKPSLSASAACGHAVS
jgi:hypothetical protein